MNNDECVGALIQDMQSEEMSLERLPYGRRAASHACHGESGEEGKARKDRTENS